MVKLTLIQGDCLKVLSTIPDKSIDLVLTDPPYGKRWARGLNGIGQVKRTNEVVENLFWDKHIPEKKYFDEIMRVSKNQIIFGGNYFTNFLPPSNCWIVWDKKADTKDLGVFADIELCWTSFTRVAKKYTCRAMGFIKDTKDQRFHPTQKPTELINMIIKDFVKENQIVLDCFLGSGTTMISCLKAGIDCIGIEIEPKYIEICKKRLNWGSSLGNVEFEFKVFK